MAQRFRAFFQQYANAMQNKHLESLKSMYRLPFIIVHDEPKSVVSFSQKLELNIKKVLDYFQELSITNIDILVQKSFHLSNDVYFANVNWMFRNEDGKVLITYSTSYMLNVTEVEIKIITVIVDDENDTYLKLID